MDGWPRYLGYLDINEQRLYTIRSGLNHAHVFSPNLNDSLVLNCIQIYQHVWVAGEVIHTVFIINISRYKTK